MIVIAITVITFAIRKANFPSYLMFLRVLSVMSQQPPATQRGTTLYIKCDHYQGWLTTMHF